jgi:CheY-like chemotaxis protein
MNPRKVLIVEDDPEIRDLLIEILEANGCEAVGAGNGAQALSYLRHARPLPCVVLLDLVMPIMDGVSFREAQLSDRVLAKIPVIVVSASRDAPESAQKLKAGFLRKPVETRDLVKAVAQCAEAN